ncbi:cell wall hydrolase [Clostridium pasteurianum DSM 525 = ATCC 6013]|uniref:Cell wall hydrolase n=1 Tax=Clostridium pasteurianum DSM 525 = ATCC 6013 TaxID=1262449 RepID=A0A0H3J812_CLOPA|nr:cell wall hydrolase [Clostridium pasteurianum]AJA49347.1 cell wall hydrolase [Clostridium pasteurianum DSM 525 = ATCC 6013]AJA53335.1 cell wall hydrolase [Clostridium pasteurianum DSM 525 = ATCC 6013]AOZ76521.1 cell wall hydrolase [Clostridium pasteurianum DSM 525 = ATCC 6013]AOZ80318.1 cell wall hydrolase [Clostridium pasteurianum]ELP58367.1 putative cell wall hydrolase [Clostridium pasteurianum DSM 525 = ATCC 6013]
MAYSDRELLARIIKCEAGGEGDNGMKAVATVVMNRVRVPYGEYQRIGQGDVRKIIYQQGQFDCVRSVLGGVANPQTIWANPPDQTHYDIADWAIAGNRVFTIGSSLWYFNPFIPNCPNNFPYNGTGIFQVRVGQHCFYNPTELYAQT